MKTAIAILSIGLAGCGGAAKEEYNRVTKKAVADCEALGGRPSIGVDMGHVLYFDCDFALNREREKLGRCIAEQPTLGTGAGRWKQ